VAIQADLTRKDEIRRLFDACREAFGRLDILVNNAGIYEFQALAEITEEHFYRQFDLNVLAIILTIQQAATHFGPEGGSIINIGSLAATITPPQAAIYSATKAAVNAITRSFARELGPRRIRINSVNPGLVLTEGVQSARIDQGELWKSIEVETPLGRVGRPEDIANMVAFLASDDAAWITGECHFVTGGYF
jgi:3-oxoacyl-[acyl-carrier protein] reductase